MNPMEIIQLTPDDWPMYRALRLEALQTEPQAFGSTYANNVQHPESFWRGRLEVNTEQAAARKLYASFGFQVVASEYTLAGDGQYHDVHVMEKRLD